MREEGVWERTRHKEVRVTGTQVAESYCERDYLYPAIRELSLYAIEDEVRACRRGWQDCFWSVHFPPGDDAMVIKLSILPDA